jgi:hypothetical protein
MVHREGEKCPSFNNLQRILVGWGAITLLHYLTDSKKETRGQTLASIWHESMEIGTDCQMGERHFSLANEMSAFRKRPDRLPSKES